MEGKVVVSMCQSYSFEQRQRRPLLPPMSCIDAEWAGDVV